MSTTSVRCKRCPSLIHPDDINIERQFANCRVCHAVFRLSSAPTAAQTATSSAVTPAPKHLARGASAPRVVNDAKPFARWTVSRGDGVIIRIRWLKSWGVFFAVLLAPCVGALWVGGAQLLRGDIRGDVVDALVVGAVILCISAVLAYVMVANFLNSTTLHADRRGLRVAHRPLPFPRAVDLLRGDIDQLFCRESVHERRYNYALVVLMMDGRERIIWSGSANDGEAECAAQALYLEGALEVALGIKDRPIEDEYKEPLHAAFSATLSASARPSGDEGLRCRRCRASIHPDDVNDERQFAHCRVCHAVFSIKPPAAAALTMGEVTGAGELELLPQPGQEREVQHVPLKMMSGASRRRISRFEMPSRWEISEAGSQLQIKIHWSWVTAMTLSGVGGFFFFYSVSKRLILSDKAGSIFYGVILAAMGLWMLLIGIKHFLNTTYITVDNQGVTVAHRPIKWRGDGRILKKNIEQICCVRSVKRDSDSGSRHFRYAVHVRLKSGDVRPLINASVIDTPEQALYLERAIEDRLGIQDMPVEGEYRG